MQDKLPTLPLFNFPPELIDAAKSAKRASEAVAINADKWGQVADAVLSWHSLVFVLLGIFIGVLLWNAFKPERRTL